MELYKELHGIARSSSSIHFISSSFWLITLLLLARYLRQPLEIVGIAFCCSVGCVIGVRYILNCQKFGIFIFYLDQQSFFPHCEHSSTALWGTASPK
ncbi:hypothetical protein DTO006G1_4946 [Penicillium roqueforti]|nr:hypothetical protein DTO013F2_6964 [Penicillium roqueforti]KAI2760403.1 hypothetical protein DTO006G1_4946 [Penicillium roqueforti]KAI3192852.1 hypothetical protein DTO032C6_42 [Penicillium roqueforti]KAI3253126.1 hypothetical protein DTO006G7_6348 [Penicillium roqueforti]